MRKIVLLLLLVVSGASAFAFGGTTISVSQYRWRADNGSESSATWYAGTNTPLSLTAGTVQNLRLRMSINVTGEQATDTTASTELQYLDFNSGNWITITSDGTNDFKMATSTNVAGNTNTTNQVSFNNPFMGGKVIDAGGPFTFSYHAEQSTTYAYEHEWVIRPTAHARTGSYQFRLLGTNQPFFISPVYAQLDYTVPEFSYAGSPFCDTTSTGSVNNSYPAGGTYSAGAGLMINGTTGAVDLRNSTAGLYTVTYTYSGGSATTQVAVRPQIANQTGMNSLGNQAVCAGSATQAVNFSSPIQNLGYTWTSSNPAIGSGASGTGDLPSFTAVNNGTDPIYSQINVTANGGTGCKFKPTAFRIAVYPIPSVNGISNQSFCTGQPVNAQTFTGPVAGTYYTWTSSSRAAGLSVTKGTNTVPAFTTSGTMNTSTTITVTPNGPNHCVGAPMSYQIIVGNCVTGVGNTGNGGARLALDQSIVAGPNPTTGVVRVQYSGDATQLDVLVRDAYGTILMPVRRVASNNIQVDLSSLRPGSYSVQFADPRSGASIVRTIVKL